MREGRMMMQALEEIAMEAAAIFATLTGAYVLIAAVVTLLEERGVEKERERRRQTAQRFSRRADH
jgi:hypothetical protein